MPSKQDVWARWGRDQCRPWLCFCPLGLWLSLYHGVHQRHRGSLGLTPLGDPVSLWRVLVPELLPLTFVVYNLRCLTQVSQWVNSVMWATYSPDQPLGLTHVCWLVGVPTMPPQSTAPKSDGCGGRHYLPCAHHNCHGKSVYISPLFGLPAHRWLYPFST